ncbi:MAG: class I SAM-dependent methyltransferase [Chthoniobacteraceae bacterium]
MSETPQNVYDNPDFFAGYKELRRVESGLNSALEIPALLRMLPSSLAGLRILDLGCGFGDFARLARSRGAGKVTAVDVSLRMLEEARRRTADPEIQYVEASIEDFDATPGSFDLVVSSLAFHYVCDYPTAIGRIYRLLAPGGRLVFSVEHPICTALPEQQWCRSSEGVPLHWPVDCYRDEGLRRTKWFVDNVVKYHRTVETYVNGLIAAGFVLDRLEEPEPTPESIAARPDLAMHRRRPPFLLLAAHRD